MNALDHVGIAVWSLAEALETYAGKLGFRHEETEEVPAEKVRVAVLRAGRTRVELLEPTAPDSPLSRFLRKRGPGVHHLAFQVEGIEAETERLRKAGVTLLEPAPRPGAQGCKVAFLHPKSAGGVLIELVERRGG